MQTDGISCWNKLHETNHQNERDILFATCCQPFSFLPSFIFFWENVFFLSFPSFLSLPISELVSFLPSVLSLTTVLNHLAPFHKHRSSSRYTLFMSILANELTYKFSHSILPSFLSLSSSFLSISIFLHPFYLSIYLPLFIHFYLSLSPSILVIQHILYIRITNYIHVIMVRMQDWIHSRMKNSINTNRSTISSMSTRICPRDFQSIKANNPQNL